MTKTNSILKWILSILLIIVFTLISYLYTSGSFEKRASPKDTIRFKVNDLTLEVFYNRPYKKGRDIFGGLVPYNKVWRTGANEATTFSSSLPITINNKKLPKGLYTLWTIPNTSSWEIIFNSKQYPWGVDDQMKPMRDSEFDVLTVKIPVTEIDQVIEQFTIGFDNLRNPLEMYLAWDDTRINIPIIPN